MPGLHVSRPGRHYRTLITALARLAAGHESGLLGSRIEERFPFTLGQVRADDLIPYSADELSVKVGVIREFAARHPQLMPDHVREPKLLDRFATEARAFLDREREIKQYLNSQPDFIALCHWNANVDNAWFRRGDDMTLQAGLLDWGSAGQMNVAQGIYGAVCAAEIDIWDAQSEELIALFANEYAAHGGPTLDIDQRRLHGGSVTGTVFPASVVSSFQRPASGH